MGFCIGFWTKQRFFSQGFLTRPKSSTSMCSMSLLAILMAIWGIYIDGLQFVGGQRISQFHILNPPASDETSINTYGMHPFKHTDSTLSSFEQAQAEAARVLNNLHEPIPILKCTKLLPTTQLYPSNVVTVATVDYRIASEIYEWHAQNKRIEATYNMVTKTSPLPEIWTQDNVLRYLVR